MKVTIWRSILFCCLVLCSTQSVQAAKEYAEQDVQAMTTTLELRLTELRALTTQIEQAPSFDQMALLYRRDERSFELLSLLDRLARAIATLPEDSELRADLEKRMRSDLKGVPTALFTRMEELNDRILQQREDAQSKSGSERVTAESFAHSLESMRLKYFETAVNVVQSRKAMGLPVVELREKLLNIMTAYGEALVGRIEFTGVATGEIAKRLKVDPGNADLDGGLITMRLEHNLQTSRLQLFVGLLNKLGEDTTHYRSILLQNSTGVSVGLFDKEVVGDILRDSWRKSRVAIVDNLPDLLLNLLVFIAVLVLFRTLSRLVRRAMTAALDRSSVKLSTLLKEILVSGSAGTVMFVGFLMALSQVGISLAPMLAGLGVAGFIVGFALQDTLGNFAAGAMILIYRPYDVDDFVEVTGASGLVKKMTLVSTTINTFDNQTLVIPNSKIWGDVIKNVTAQKLRRVDLEFGVGYDDDVEHVERVLDEIVSAHEKTLSSPEPLIKLHTLGESSVNFIVRPWVRTEDYWTVYWDLMREVKVRFDREGISIPFPQRDVHHYRLDEVKP
ncbi:MAG: mechanosensitive ion channel family protein [Halioglobus sp.]